MKQEGGIKVLGETNETVLWLIKIDDFLMTTSDFMFRNTREAGVPKPSTDNIPLTSMNTSLVIDYCTILIPSLNVCEYVFMSPNHSVYASFLLDHACKKFNLQKNDYELRWVFSNEQVTDNTVLIPKNVVKLVLINF